MPKPHVAFLLVVPLLALSACAQTAVVETEAPVSPETQAAEASPVFADTRWLDNGTIRLGVSPSVGRITWFGWSDGGNLLWVNPQTVNVPPDGDPEAWINYGGDKPWVGPQNSWPYFLPSGKDWPPDGSLDGEPWRVLLHNDATIVLLSPLSEAQGVRLTRKIRMLPGEAAVMVRTDAKCEGEGSPMPAQLWNVTQVRVPDAVALGVGEVPGGPGGGLRMVDGEKFEGELEERDGHTVWTPAGRPTGKKLGTIGGWIAAQFGDTMLIQTSPYDAHGIYPENSSTQLYVADDYVELEMLSPATQLRRGRTLTHEVVWGLWSLESVGQTWDVLLEAVASERN